MNMNSRLYSAVILDTYWCTRDDASSGYDGTHCFQNAEKLFLCECYICTPIEIDKKLENVRFLFDNVHFLPAPDTREIFNKECINVLVWHVEHSTIHEIVCPGTLAYSPFVEESRHAT